MRIVPARYGQAVVGEGGVCRAQELIELLLASIVQSSLGFRRLSRVLRGPAVSSPAGPLGFVPGSRQRHPGQTVLFWRRMRARRCRDLCDTRLCCARTRRMSSSGRAIRGAGLWWIPQSLGIEGSRLPPTPERSPKCKPRQAPKAGADCSAESLNSFRGRDHANTEASVLGNRSASRPLHVGQKLLRRGKSLLRPLCHHPIEEFLVTPIWTGKLRHRFRQVSQHDL